MAAFDSFKDVPYQIRTEGQHITIKFEKTSPSTARISWNIPTPAVGCDISNQAYNGIVITLDNETTHQGKAPVDGTYYISDPTADKNLHAGDKISTAIVVGAFYDNKITTSIDVTGIIDNVPYYVSGFAVDAQCRYHTDGAHAFSMPYGNANGTSFPSTHSLCISSALTAPTGLLPATQYTFNMGANGNAPVIITIDGTNASTFQALMDEITKQIALIDNPPQSATVPNLNQYFFSVTTNELFKWNGSTHVSVPVTVEPIDPSIPALNDYWVDTSGIINILKKYNGAVWITQTHFDYHRDITNPTCDDYWFNGTNIYRWNGTVWMPRTLMLGGIDPSLAPNVPCNSYWYDETTETLNVWNNGASCATGLGAWGDALAILSPTDPTTPAINDYWFDETADVVTQWDGLVWTTVFAQITNVEPATPGPGLLWYNPEDTVLKIYSGIAWVVTPIINWATAPNVVVAGSLWWNETTDDLYIWDVTTSSWDLIANFTISTIDPSLAPILPVDTMWYTNDMFYCWDGSMWNAVTVVSTLADPTIRTINDYWFDTVNLKWFNWSGIAWIEIFPTTLATDPYIPVVGSFWFNTTLTLLNQWNGISWINTLFSTIPLTPVAGSTYFNTISNTLKVWNPTLGWVNAVLPVTLSYDATSMCIVFTSSILGSKSIVALEDIDLFSSLIPVGELSQIVLGSDGLSGSPSYGEVGIGDDGSSDERRELMDSIRAQLGYPVVEVELTKYQLDTAVTSAIESLRKHSGSAYKRAMFFLDIVPGKQKYLMTNKLVGFNKIVNISAIYRMQSSFFGSAEGQGLYGQLMLQHMYHMGTFDLISYHIVSEYVELMNQMFATDIVYTWDESSRVLFMMQTFGMYERVLIDATIERTEQEMFRDRWTKSWIEKYALATSRYMLAEIRGKFASLPGAGGGVSLNAGDLISAADRDIADCMAQIDDFVVNNIEDYGMSTAFVIG